MNKSLTLSATSQASNIYDSIGAKIIVNSTDHHHQLLPNLQTSNAQNSNTLPPLPTHRPEYLNFDRDTLDHRLKNSAPSDDLQKNVELRSKNNGIGCKPSSDEYNRLSGSEYVTNNIDFSNSNQIIQIQQRINNSSTMNNKNRQSRNHIITDTLPGPESCV